MSQDLREKLLSHVVKLLTDQNAVGLRDTVDTLIDDVVALRMALEPFARIHARVIETQNYITGAGSAEIAKMALAQSNERLAKIGVSDE